MRTLTSSDFDAIHTAFNEAFSDYVVPLALTPEQLREMLTRRGWVPEASAAFEEDGRIVAFTLNCIEGTTGYDTGTGVVPTHRRRRLAAQLMHESERLLRDHGCTHYLLEVIEANEKAVALYESLGFEQTRALQCWFYESASDSTAQATPILRPSWQNSDGSVARATAEHVRIGDDRDYLILFPGNGDVPQFHGTITTRLLNDAFAKAGKPLRIINLDERDTAFAQFLEAAGARKIVRQKEMIKTL